MDIASWLREVRMFTNTSDWNATFVNNRLDEAANEIERLRDEVHFDDQTIKSLSEIKDRLQESLKKIAELDIDRSVAQRYRPDGIPSKMDRCNHGIAMYDECAECVADFARAALKESE